MPGPSVNAACFYEYPQFQGRYFCVNPGRSLVHLSEIAFNNQISSMIIPNGFYVRVYEYEGYAGDSLTLTGVIDDLRSYGWNWDDNISSLDYRY